MNYGYYQQGDVLLKETSKPENIEIIETDLLHKGQAHHHRIRGKFKIGVNKNGEIFVHSKGSELFHEEHNTIKIPEGFYKLDLVLEYDHFLEESRVVID